MEVSHTIGEESQSVCKWRHQVLKFKTEEPLKLYLFTSLQLSTVLRMETSAIWISEFRIFVPFLSEKKDYMGR